MILLLLKLLIAHALGDFVFQPSQWVVHKRQRKQRSIYLYLHLLVHTTALLLVLQFKGMYWPAILSIISTHYVIDLIKLQLDTKINPRLLFTLDQLAHFLVILAIVYVYEPFKIDISQFYFLDNLFLVFALITLTSISSIVMNIIMSKWKLNEDGTSDSLENAGKYIGILERLFVFALIVMNQWQVIGFLLAAKSVFRFGDLSKAKDRKLTEYILIGTLLSFGFAISIGLMYKYAIQK